MQIDVLKIVVLGSVAIALAGFVGSLMSLLWRELAPDARTELNKSLEQSGLSVSPQAWRELHRRVQRRQRWGGIGSGVGFALGLLVSFALPSAAAGQSGLLAVAGGFVGVQFGQALSSQFRLADRESPLRVSSLQPHDLRDYLRTRELAFEWCALIAALMVGALGIAGLVSGVTAMALTTDWLLTSLGLAVALVAATALALQRRLVHAPMSADGEAGLVANDITLMTGLRDLIAAVGIAVMMSVYSYLVAIGLPWWQALGGLLLAGGMIRLFVDPRPGAEGTPVAQRLAGVRPA